MWPERTQLPQKDVPPQNRYQLRRNGRPDRSTPASGRGYASEYPGLRPQFRQELIPNILNIVGAVPRCPILLQNIFPIYNFKGDGNSDMTAGSIVKGSTGITKS